MLLSDVAFVKVEKHLFLRTNNEKRPPGNLFQEGASLGGEERTRTSDLHDVNVTI